MLLIRSANLTTTFQLWFTSVKLSYCAPGMLEVISERIHGERTVTVTILVENKKKKSEMRNVKCCTCF